MIQNKIIVRDQMQTDYEYSLAEPVVEVFAGLPSSSGPDYSGS